MVVVLAAVHSVVAAEAMVAPAAVGLPAQVAEATKVKVVVSRAALTGEAAVAAADRDWEAVAGGRNRNPNTPC